MNGTIRKNGVDSVPGLYVAVIGPETGVFARSGFGHTRTCIAERKQQLSRNDMSNTSEKILQKTRLIQKKLSSTPPLELFDESVFKELVKKVLISNTAIQFELINGMKLSESRAAT